MRGTLRQLASKALLGFVSVVLLFSPIAAGAIPVEVTTPVFDPVTGSQQTVGTATAIKEWTWDGLKVVLANSAALALLNAGNYFAQRIAYDTANYIASGGKGQKPLFITKGVGAYLEDVAGGAAGEALGTFSENRFFKELGINLCKPTNPRIALNISLGFTANLPRSGQPQPRCDWNEVKGNWDQFTSQDSSRVLDQVGVMFTPGQSSLSVAMDFQSASRELISKEEGDAITEFVAGGRFKAVTDAISGRVLTPEETIKEQMKLSQQQGFEQQGKDIAITGDAFAAGAYGILGAAMKTFTNTLAQKMMQRVFERGLISIGQILGSEQGESNVIKNPLVDGSASPQGGRASAELANADFLTPKIFSVTNFDALLEFSSCPADFRYANNCVMDNQFYTAVNRASEGVPLTVRQAVDQGFISGSWRLIPVSHAKNTDKNCYQEALCYSNLIKLRNARIIPIGWELAANSAFNDPTDPVTLREAMDKFNDCPILPDGSIDFDKLQQGDPVHPWCRLIDPNWVLKYPKQICRQNAPGPVLLDPGSATRARTCSDAPTCIAEDEKGNCVGGYGYCVREKNVWKIDADSCPAHFASCQAFKSATGQAASYLTSTVTAGICDADNAGCRQYSLSQNLVPNPGFEDSIPSGAARTPVGWNSIAGRQDYSWGKTDALQGSAALGGSSLFSFAIVPSVVPGQTYRMVVNAKKDAAGTGTATFFMHFYDRNAIPLIPTGLPAAIPNAGIITDCEKDAVGGILLSVSAGRFGYATKACNVTAPANAAFVDFGLSSDSKMWFDNLGFFGQAWSAAPSDNIFLNGKVKACPEGQVGCTQLVRASTGTLNLVRNPGFETADGAIAAGWSMAAGQYAGNGFTGFEGGSAARATSAAFTQAVRGLLPNATYVFSAYSKRETGASGSRATITLLNGAGGAVPGGSVTTDCTSAAGNVITQNLGNGADFVRSSCRFTTPSDIGSAVIAFASSDANPALIDAVQIELAAAETSYHAGYDQSAERVALKVAPQSLNCSGSSTDHAECRNYAPVCLREEVGCNRYVPGGGTAVTAITTSGDLCPAACDGYDSYRPDPTAFSPGPQDYAYFIPSTATSCSASEAGCEEFTNLATLAAGGEAREYYSALRLCKRPDTSTGTYYTWEGNAERGFQLRTWALATSNVTSPGGTAADPTGGVGPCTNLRYDADGTPVCSDVQPAVCSKAQVGINPDCREFYDVDGRIHYRLYSRTIVASDACAEFRMTRSVQTDCEASGGYWTRNECHYFSLRSESSACRASSAQCKGYAGNASRNIRRVFDDTFEGGTSSDWSQTVGAVPSCNASSGSGVCNSNEAVSSGGHSLSFTPAAIFKPLFAPDEDGTPGSLITAGKTYSLTFWAKGSGTLSGALVLGGQETPFEGLASLTTEWKVYTIGPVAPAKGAVAGDAIVLRKSGSGTVFVDNVVLQEAVEKVYVVAGSWNTPAVCDQTPTGASSPRYMLGCKAYTDKDNRKAYLKSFTQLCRDTAVGCEAMYDTKNSASPFPQTKNAACTLSSACVATDSSMSSNGVTCPCIEAGKTLCQVTNRETSCRYDLDGEWSGSAPDVVRLPGDSLIYVINDRRFACDAAFKGCVAVGDRELNPDGDLITKWTKKTLVNDPDAYDTILCSKSEEYCQAFTRVEDNTQAFFKDPGNHVCEYRQGVVVGGSTVSGWFKKGIDEPCYLDNFQSGAFYGIWKNSDPAFRDWAGSCPSNVSRCKEFLDTTDVSPENPGGFPYYVIANGRLDVRSCAGQVSRTTSPSSANDASSCVLFRQADDLNLKYSAAATYAASDAKFGALVPPVSTAANDANIILRVKRDRQCGTWLDCRTSETVFNQASGQYQNVCTAFALCAEYEKVGDATRCTRYITNPDTGTILTAPVYQGRDILWSGKEYSGFSIPNKYPIEELSTVLVPVGGGRQEPRLAYVAGACSGADFSECGESRPLFGGANGETRTARGTCFENKCTYPIDGSAPVRTPTAVKQSDKVAMPALSCRAYPQENAPFPSSVADPNGWDMSQAELNNGNPSLISASPAFQGANICQRRLIGGVEVSSCECSYTVASYGTDKRYFPIDEASIPSGYCEAGTYAGFECDPLSEGLRAIGNLSCCSKLSKDSTASDPICDTGGECKVVTKVDYIAGYQGQCLERDLTIAINNEPDQYACATWRPVGLVGGTRDIFNLNRTAGHFTSADRRFYCAGEQAPWTLHLPIVTRMPIEFAAESGIPAGDSMGDQGPRYQLTGLYFGPGTVTGLKPSAQSGVRCTEHFEGRSEWCVIPGLSSQCSLDGVTSDAGTLAPGAPCTDATGSYTIQKPAYSVLGCYEVSDNGPGPEETLIEWPYIGPPIYRDQLTSIYFDVARSLYPTNPSYTPVAPWNLSTAENPTNPHQYVGSDCSDQNDDRWVNGFLTHERSASGQNAMAPVDRYASYISSCRTDSDCSFNEFAKCERRYPADEFGYCNPTTIAVNGNQSRKHMSETNKWKAELVEGGGTAAMEAFFSSTGRLTSLRFKARDDHYEGTIGIAAMGFAFKAGCSAVAEVDVPGEFGLTKAYTDTVNGVGQFTERGDAGVDTSRFEQACRPWGAIGAVSADPIANGMNASPWTYVARHPVGIDGVELPVAACTLESFRKGSGYVTNRLDARNRLEDLFRKVSTIWNFRKIGTESHVNTDGGFSDFLYLNAGDSAITREAALYDATVNGETIIPPRVASVNTALCDPNNRCPAKTIDTISISGRDGGVVNAVGGAFQADLKFFAWASHDAMPIVQRIVDWGDLAPKEPAAKGWYKNHKPYCSSDTSDAGAIFECADIPGLSCKENSDCPGSSCQIVANPQNHFGNTPGACTDSPFVFSHTYTCSSKDADDLRGAKAAAGAAAECALDPVTGIATNAPCLITSGAAVTCVYQPHVTVIDNWGWCNCTGSRCRVVNGVLGAFGPECLNPTVTQPWTAFRGDIRVQSSGL